MLIMPTLDAECFYTCVTSPPYWGLRDYGIPPTVWPETTYTPMPGLPPVTVPAWTGCLGLEPMPEMFVAHSVAVFREVWRLLRKDGTLWLNYGDSYAGSGKGGGGSYEKERPGWQQAKSKRIERGSGRWGGGNSPAGNGLKPKDLIGIPWRVAFALQADGWYLRMDNIWSKPNPMPESVADRPTKAHEYLFLLAKSDRYYCNMDEIKELAVADHLPGNHSHKGTNAYEAGDKHFRTKAGLVAYAQKVRANSFARKVNESPPPGQPQQHRPDREDIEYNGMRNKRSVWTVATQAFPEAHFATFPEKLIEPCILAGAPSGGHVLDPFGGSGTTRKVALENNRECTIIEIGPQYVEIAQRRTAVIQQQLF
ncbi:site-specific DNA-methyltransferase [Paenibacillus sp. S150]|uniref:DNA-methyltransferase n=1 Tax=Paenibacillus sp. S150 TaxID=2749826 RepID=UPI001C6226CE|nr:site-specific DNA-methyltransferase [Paenibacillus sp. S150]MBW4083592.1 site-specific DNA-methyltransferase [Paenibacillus sp. S150]